MKGAGGIGGDKRIAVRDNGQAEPIAQQTLIGTKTTAVSGDQLTSGAVKLGGLASKVEAPVPGAFNVQVQLRALSPQQRAAFSMDPEKLVDMFAEEIVAAYEFAASLKEAFPIFGSARTPEGHEKFEEAKKWGETLLLANVYAASPELAIRAITSTKFSAEASKAVAGVVLGAGVGAHGALEVSKTLAAIGGASSPEALADAVKVLNAQKVQDRVLDVMRSVVRSGAGPGIMEAVLAGYSEARGKLLELNPNLPKSVLGELEIQGSRIFLPFEQETSRYFNPDPKAPGGPLKALLHTFHHFDPRREALMLMAPGLISEIGGVGTLNEDFVALRKGMPVVFDKSYYGSIIGTILQKWKERGFSQDVAPNVLLHEGPVDGYPALVKLAAEKPPLVKPTVEQAKAMAADFILGIAKLTHLEPAVSVFASKGLKTDSVEAQVATRVIGKLAKTGAPIRLGGQGGVFEQFASAVKDASPKAPKLQVTLLDKGNVDLEAVSKRPEVFHVAHSPNAHKVLMYEGTDAFLLTPGGDGVFDELFEILCLMQTGKIAKRPVVLIGDDFWAPVLDEIHAKMSASDPKTIGDEDLKLLTVLKTSGKVTAEDRTKRPYNVKTEAEVVAEIRLHRAKREAESA